MSKRHQAIADELSKTFSAETIKNWEEMVKTWDKDKSAQNPYAEPHCSKLFVKGLLYISNQKSSDNAPRCASRTCERGSGECC
jgi:hypothetical protein